MTRRHFVSHGVRAAAAACMLKSWAAGSPDVPSYLKGYETLYSKNPRQAALEWFRNARFGLFLHYGLYSLLGRGEWVMYNEKIPLQEYKKLRRQFSATKFNADYITGLALEGGMKYITITSKHHDGFCLFRTKQTDFNVMNTPAQRDLMGELAASCRKKGLGIFFYYSYAADWTHPWFPGLSSGIKSARPHYDTPEPAYLWRKDSDTRRYIDYVNAQVKELLTQYGPIAGIWFDPMMGYYYRRDLFPVDETYAMIRSIQPQCLISFKQGASGKEDFIVPEFKWTARTSKDMTPDQLAYANDVWQKGQGKPGEFSIALGGYSYTIGRKHGGVDYLWQYLRVGASRKANILCGTGPRGDGSIQEEDAKTFREVGRRIRNEGLPRVPEGVIEEPPTVD